MPISLMKSGIAVGVGVLDEVAEYMDDNVKAADGTTPAPRTKSFKNAKDIYRLGAAAIGYGMMMIMPKHDKLGETIAISATPLLAKSIARAVRVSQKWGYIPTVTGYAGDFVPRRTAQYSPVRRNASARQPEFEGIRII